MVIATVALVLAIVAVAAPSNATDVPPVPLTLADLGDTSLLRMACNYVAGIAPAELQLSHCRRRAVDDPEKNFHSAVHMRYFSIAGPIDVDVVMVKSLWSIESLQVLR